MSTTPFACTSVPSHQRLRQTIHSEWTKLTSLRSSRWTLLGFVVTGIALAIVIGAVSGARFSHLSAGSRANWDPTNNTGAALIPGYVIIPVLGLFSMTSEYRSSAISSTLTATPARLRALGSKVLAFALSTLVAAEAVSFGAFFSGQAIYAHDHVPYAALTQPGVARAVVLSGVYLVLLGLFALGLGAIVRTSAAAVAIYAGFVFVVPQILFGLPGHLDRLGPILMLANSVGAVKIGHGFFSPWISLGLMALYAGLGLAVGAVLLIGRDA